MLPLALSDLKVFGDEPRVHDLRLAEVLGFEQARDIRKLIGRNRQELDTYGELICATVAQNGRGRPTEEFWLTEAQALLICVRSDAQNAPAVRKTLIQVFMAYRRCQIIPADLVEEIHRTNGMCKTLVKKVTEHDRAIDTLMESTAHLKAASELSMDRLIELTAQMKALAAPAPDLMMAQDYVPAITIVADIAKVPPEKRYSGLCSWVSKRVRIFVGDRNLKKLPTYPGTKDAFPRDAAVEWLEKGGREQIWIRVNERAAKKAGQNVLPFPSNSPTKPGA